MEGIKDYKVYDEGMRKSLRDKLFFEGLIEEVDTLIDYGCADGTLLKQVQEDFPSWNLIGIDMDEKMVDHAMAKCWGPVYYHCDRIPADDLKKVSENAIFVLSSVIHEIYSYSSTEVINNFWNDLFNLGVKYISIRDMMTSNSSYRNSDINDVMKIRNRCRRDIINDFEKVWGSLNNQYNLIHFLLKYQYVNSPSWNREILENYLPLTIEELMSKIPSDKYRITYYEHYVLPYTKNRIMKEEGIELKDNTHIKLILERI